MTRVETVSRPRPGDVLSAQDYLRRMVVRTPAIRSAALDERTGCRLVAKAECLQRTGSFKVRGALNRARTLPPEARARGLLTVSAGNAALGLAFAGDVLGAGCDRQRGGDPRCGARAGDDAQGCRRAIGRSRAGGDHRAARQRDRWHHRAHAVRREHLASGPRGLHHRDRLTPAWRGPGQE